MTHCAPMLPKVWGTPRTVAEPAADMGVRQAGRDRAGAALGFRPHLKL